MMRCLVMKVEGALEQIFGMAGLDIRDLLRQILNRWREENYLGLVDAAGASILENQPDGFSFIVYCNLRAVCLLDAIKEHLRNAVVCALAVEFDRASGGERCHLIDLTFEELENIL